MEWRSTKWAGHVAPLGQAMNAYEIFNLKTWCKIRFRGSICQ